MFVVNDDNIKDELVEMKKIIQGFNTLGLDKFKRNITIAKTKLLQDRFMHLRSFVKDSNDQMLKKDLRDINKGLDSITIIMYNWYKMEDWKDNLFLSGKEFVSNQVRKELSHINGIDSSDEYKVVLKLLDMFTTKYPSYRLIIGNNNTIDINIPKEEVNQYIRVCAFSDTISELENNKDQMSEGKFRLEMRKILLDIDMFIEANKDMSHYSKAAIILKNGFIDKVNKLKKKYDIKDTYIKYYPYSKSLSVDQYSDIRKCIDLSKLVVPVKEFKFETSDTHKYGKLDAVTSIKLNKHKIVWRENMVKNKTFFRYVLDMVREHDLVTEIILNGDSKLINRILKDFKGIIAICDRDNGETIIGTIKARNRWFGGGKHRAEKILANYLIGSSQYFLLEAYNNKENRKDIDMKHLINTLK